ncbi:MAG: NAD(P)-dependent oxidoreductase [Pyrinomonadaceae bacterium]|nr:NAD(P)-dependent oxidoreductase [Pyrinomonadaceae bacterium]
MKLLITGSRGFVGGSVGREGMLVGHQVLGISRATQADTGWTGDYVAADVVSADLDPVVRKFAPDVVVHAAGTASVGASFAAPLDDLRASMLSWANLLDGIRRSGTNPLILFPSSGAVYGQVANLPVSEKAEIQPISPYGFHKAACELLGREYATCFGLRIVVCRLFSLFGEQQRRLLIWELYRQFTGEHEVVWLQGTGRETRDYLHAQDMAGAMISLGESQFRERPCGHFEVLNVGSGVETSVLDLAEQLGRMVAPAKEIRCRGVERAGDPERWQADSSALRALLPDWNPRPLAEGLASCVAGWRNANC